MTVENTNREIRYTGNNSVTIFAYDFLVYSDNHLFVYFDDIEQTTGFTISGIGEDSGGSVTFDAAPLFGVDVKIERIVPYTQLIDYQQYGQFDAESNERGLDLAAMRDIQIGDDINYLYENALLKNKAELQTVNGTVTFNEKLKAEKTPSDPTDVLRLQDIKSGDSLKSSFTKFNISISPGQTVLVTPTEFQSANVFIDSEMQFESDGAYTHDGAAKTITLTEALDGDELVEVWINNLFVAPSSSNNTFAGLLDTPFGYAGSGGKRLVVKADLTGIEFADEGIQTNFKSYQTIEEALLDFDLDKYQLIDIAELAAADTSLTQWDVVATSTITPNAWNKRESTSNPLISIVLRGTDNFVKNKNFAPMEVIAHRGFEQAAVENTTLAFSIAALHKASLECDCQPSADGTIWMFHDDLLDGDTNLTGTVYSSTDAYLETATFTDNIGSSLEDQRMSKFESLLDIASKGSLRIYPELKGAAGWSFEDVDTFLALLDQYGYLNQNCVIQAVSIDLLQYVRAQNSDVGIAILGFKSLAISKDDIDTVYALGGASAVWSAFALLDEPALVEYFFSLGMNIYAYTVNDVDEALALKQLHINGIMTNTLVGGI